jgi:tRNA-dihydrouridine synthase B
MPEHRTIKEIFPPQALVLAPMAGITDPPYRLLASEHGADWTYTEMMSAEGLVRGHQGTRRLLETYPHAGPLMGQIFGTDPGVMAEAAACVQERGLAGVDINVGCPATKVVKKVAGAALLREPQRLQEILKQVRAVLHIPLGIKIRSGWDERIKNCLEIVQMAEACGVDVVAIHPRARSQKFEGEADWGLIRQAKECTGVTVIGNGDVRTPADAARMLHETGCDGVMIGRGSWGNPWIFAQARALIHQGEEILPPAWEEREALIYRHLEMLLQRRGTPWGLIAFIKHVGWYVKGYPAASDFRRRISTIRSQEVFVREMEVYFRQIANKQGERRCPLLMPAA